MIAALFTLVGIALIVLGARMISLEVGLITAGVIMVLLGLGGSRAT